LDGQRYPILEFDGQNQPKTRVGWLKMDFFLKQIGMVVRYVAFVGLAVTLSEYSYARFLWRVVHFVFGIAPLLNIEDMLHQWLQ
jgi:hypothetical protein